MAVGGEAVRRAGELNAVILEMRGRNSAAGENANNRIRAPTRE